MLSYQHDYHAGHHADVLKHSVLLLVIRALQRKTTPLRVIDSHAGSGVYDLTSAMAQHGREYESGAARVLRAAAAPQPLLPYLEAIRRLNEPDTLRYYPGSPELALGALREHDRLELFELHPQAAAALRARFGRHRQVHVHRRDGFEGLVGVVPPPEKRGVALIDPSYEQKDEFARVVKVVAACYRRFGNGVYVVWYPLIANPGPMRLVAQLRKLRLPRAFHVELEIAPDAEGLRGSGLVIANLPYRLDVEIAELVQWLARALGEKRGTCRAAWLG